MENTNQLGQRARAGGEGTSGQEGSGCHRDDDGYCRLFRLSVQPLGMTKVTAAGHLKKPLRQVVTSKVTFWKTSHTPSHIAPLQSPVTTETDPIKFARDTESGWNTSSFDYDRFFFLFVCFMNKKRIIKSSKRAYLLGIQRSLKQGETEKSKHFWACFSYEERSKYPKCVCLVETFLLYTDTWVITSQASTHSPPPQPPNLSLLSGIYP